MLDSFGRRSSATWAAGKTVLRRRPSGRILQTHLSAAKFVRSHAAARFVLTELVLAEVATRLRARAGAERAVAVVRELLRSKRYELIFIDSPVLDGALERMNRFADKRLSLADCASMELIDRLRLGGAFTFDADFRDCGVRSFP